MTTSQRPMGPRSLGAVSQVRTAGQLSCVEDHRGCGEGLSLIAVLVLAVMLSSHSAGASDSLVTLCSGDSSGCSGLRTRLESCFKRAEPAWRKSPDGQRERASWRLERMPSLSTATVFRPPLPGRHGFEAAACSLAVWSEFYVDGDTIAFTQGRAPEECSEAPRMIWREAGRLQRRRALVPLFNWNVERLWCTEHYLVFGVS